MSSSAPRLDRRRVDAAAARPHLDGGRRQEGGGREGGRYSRAARRTSRSGPDGGVEGGAQLLDRVLALLALGRAALLLRHRRLVGRKLLWRRRRRPVRAARADGVGLKGRDGVGVGHRGEGRGREHGGPERLAPFALPGAARSRSSGWAAVRARGGCCPGRRAALRPASRRRGTVTRHGESVHVRSRRGRVGAQCASCV